jgi:hypothetical protein
MFGYRSPLRRCRYVGGTAQSFVWSVVKFLAICTVLGIACL